MPPDPYPDLTDPELLDPATVSDEGAVEERPVLDEADSRLLDALSQPAPPVVTAVEDQPRRGRAAQVDRRPSPLAPVFQEPTA